MVLCKKWCFLRKGDVMTLSLGNHFRLFICVVFMGVLVGYVTTAERDVTDSVYIDVVKEGYMAGFSDVTVREAFNYSFNEPYWRYYEAKTGQHVVELSGGITHAGESGHAILQFIVNEEATEFEVGAMKLDDSIQKKEDKLAIVQTVYTDWYAKQVALQ